MTNIKIVNGNVVDALLNGEINYLIHGCNAQGVMGSGVAKEIRERIPEAYGSYKFEYDNFGLELGSVTLGGGVLNCITQEFYGRDGKRYLNYGALAISLMNSFYPMQDDHPLCVSHNVVVGIPYLIGCGLAGGDEEIVMEIIEQCLSWAKEVRLYKL